MEEEGHRSPLQLERGSGGSPATVYVSPNDRDEPSTLDHARHHYGKARHEKLVGLVSRLGSGVRRGIGVWADGAEETTAFHVPPGEVSRAAAIAGIKARQKQVLTFTPETAGNAVRYTVAYPATPFDRVLSAFRDAGVEYHTHFPAEGQQGAADLSHVVGDHEMAPQVAEAARRLGGTVESEGGTADFPGHESDRELARQEFLRIIRSRLASR